MSQHHKRNERYSALELQHRVQIIGGLRDTGLDYGRIARTLGVSLSKVETCLGEAAALRAQGFTKAEIADVIGVPRGSVGRLLSTAGSTTITQRQNQVLAVTSEMRGMQVDLIADFLDVELSTAYDIVRVLVRNGSLYPLTRVQQGKAWAYPKPPIPQRYLGWRPKDWAPSLMYANHDRAVAQARIMLVGSDPQRWISERQLYRRAEEIAAAARTNSTTRARSRSRIG
ncbi:hypothetical protein [Nocardia iowensis]|uniref:hypothetical protein n=1 Tax=Nocardia iowensis TaxID=204891 RepID=UPI001FEB6EA7|nr:hypothetical protein [Nocardia iowensis]